MCALGPTVGCDPLPSISPVQLGGYDSPACSGPILREAVTGRYAGSADSRSSPGASSNGAQGIAWFECTALSAQQTAVLPRASTVRTATGHVISLNCRTRIAADA